MEFFERNYTMKISPTLRKHLHDPSTSFCCNKVLYDCKDNSTCCSECLVDTGFREKSTHRSYTTMAYGTVSKNGNRKIKPVASVNKYKKLFSELFEGETVGLRLMKLFDKNFKILVAEKIIPFKYPPIDHIMYVIMKLMKNEAEKSGQTINDVFDAIPIPLSKRPEKYVEIEYVLNYYFRDEAYISEEELKKQRENKFHEFKRLLSLIEEEKVEEEFVVFSIKQKF